MFRTRKTNVYITGSIEITWVVDINGKEQIEIAQVRFKEYKYSL